MTIETTRIEWHGGENPVREGETLVKVWYREGGWGISHTDFDDGNSWQWRHGTPGNKDGAWDIIAYAVTPDRKPEAVAEPRETLRDRVAMAALTGLLAANATYGGKTDSRELLAADAFAFADAFMAARGEA